MTAPIRPAPPAALGDVIARTDRYSRAAIEAFAALCGDDNPLHGPQAHGSRFGEAIASGQHTSSMMLGLATSHFARPRGAGAREVLVLHVNFAFRHPVFADEDVRLSWRVVELVRQDRLAGHVLRLDGEAATERAQPVLVARVGLLVKDAS